MHSKRRSGSRTSRNKLLAALPDGDYQRLLPVLSTVPLPFRHVLQKPGETARHNAIGDRQARQAQKLTF